MKGLLTRVWTAIAFVLVVLGGIYGGSYTFVLLFTLITALSLWEFLTIVLDQDSKRANFRRGLGLLLGLSPFLYIGAWQLGYIEGPFFLSKAILLYFPLLFLAFIYELFSHSDKPFINLAFLTLGVVYIGVPFALLHFIAFDGHQYFPNIVFGLLLLTWASDTGAYFAGSLLGKTPLFPRISPKKTWEGSIGGVILTLVVGYLLSLVFKDLPLIDWLVVAAIVAIFGPIGDLVESMLKRSLKVKDSGSLLPGHGGFLDRFDAFIFLLPFATVYLLW